MIQSIRFLTIDLPTCGLNSDRNDAALSTSVEFHVILCRFGIGDQVVSHTENSGYPQQIIRERYRLERLVGRGAMATVWVARDLRVGDCVAVKLLNSPATRQFRGATAISA